MRKFNEFKDFVDRLRDKDLSEGRSKDTVCTSLIIIAESEELKVIVIKATGGHGADAWENVVVVGLKGYCILGKAIYYNGPFQIEKIENGIRLTYEAGKKTTTIIDEMMNGGYG